MGLEINHGRLWDSSAGRSLGRVVDNGAYGVNIVNNYGHKVGSLRRETMCNASVLMFNQEKPVSSMLNELFPLTPQNLLTKNQNQSSIFTTSKVKDYSSLLETYSNIDFSKSIVREEE